MSRWLSAALLVALPALAGAQTGQGGTPAPAPPPSPDIYTTGTPRAVRTPRPPAPDGWLGIHYVCAIDQWTKDRELFVKHSGYPFIASVEPGSPADRAGLQAGDTILAYDGEDINGRALSLTKLLKPGNRIRVKIRRARETYEIPVTVGQKTIYARGVEVLEPGRMMNLDSLTARRVRVTARADRLRTPPAVVMVDPPEPADVVIAPPPPNFTMFWTQSTAALAGAQLVRISEQLGEPFGVSRGVLVLSVAPTTPAARAGLRDGDVIVSVNDAAVATPIQMQRILERVNDEQKAKLTVVRKKKEIVVALKW